MAEAEDEFMVLEELLAGGASDEEESAECIDIDGATTPEEFEFNQFSSSTESEPDPAPGGRGERAKLPVPPVAPHLPPADKAVPPPADEVMPAPRPGRPRRRPHLFDNTIFYIEDTGGSSDVKDPPTTALCLQW